jgi:hypothetical protein
VSCWFQVVTQISLVALLFGTLCGDFALLADVGSRAARRLWSGEAPPALVAAGGRGVMLLLVGGVVFPLCLMKRMRSLEVAATAGIAGTSDCAETNGAHVSYSACQLGQLHPVGCQS